MLSPAQELSDHLSMSPGVPQLPFFPSAHTDGLTLLHKTKQAPPESWPWEGDILEPQQTACRSEQAEK